MSSVLGFGKLLGAADDALALSLLEHCDGLIGIYDENEILRFSNAAFRET